MRILIPHEVIRIIGDPEEITLRLDHVTVEYWSVPVIMKAEKGQYESAVTFEKWEKAQKLRIGDVFLR